MKAVIGSPSFIPANPTVKISPPDNGRNDHEAEIMEILNGVILPNYSTFGLKDAYSLLASKDIPRNEISEVFCDWTVRLLSQNKIKPAALFENMYISNLV